MPKAFARIETDVEEELKLVTKSSKSILQHRRKIQHRGPRFPEGTSPWGRRGCATVLGNFWPESSGIGINFYI